MRLCSKVKPYQLLQLLWSFYDEILAYCWITNIINQWKLLWKPYFSDLKENHFLWLLYCFPHIWYYFEILGKSLYQGPMLFTVKWLVIFTLDSLCPCMLTCLWLYTQRIRRGTGGSTSYFCLFILQIASPWWTPAERYTCKSPEYRSLYLTWPDMT